MNTTEMKSDLESEVCQFIIETLALEDINVEEFSPTKILFGDGLGLDSVDALEIGVALQKKYDIKVDPADPEMRDAFATIRSLANLIENKKELS